jgi:hypothetical protein
MDDTYCTSQQNIPVYVILFRVGGGEELSAKILGVLAVLRIRDFYPGSEFFPIRIQGQKNSGSASMNLSIFNYIKKNCFQAR